MQNPRIDAFLGCFETQVQRELLDFCRRISNLDADVYILMARKASCFINCLEELGMVHMNGYVTSDRVLDIDSDWLKGKKIALIDDALVSGTTLYNTIQKLEAFEVENIEVHVLSINEKWFCKDLLEKEDGSSYLFPIYNKLPDSSCIALCYDIVRAISLVPRPYDVDFPYYHEIALTQSEFEHATTSYGWNSYNLSTEEQRRYGIANFTLIPIKDELSRISLELGIDLEDNCAVKIRVYCRQRKAKNEIRVRFVPMIVFDAFSNNEIESLFAGIIGQHERDSQLLYAFSNTAKLRFLQFYFADKLMKYWFRNVSNIFNENHELVFEQRNLSLSYPQTFYATIHDICKARYFVPAINKTTKIHNNLDSSTKYTDIDYISVSARLLEPFKLMYNKKELPCRELVKVEGKNVFLDEQYKELRERLNQGITYVDMCNLLDDCKEFYDIKTRVSLFIDQAIDAGIIVPIMQIMDDFIFRSYRHGEDVLFGSREEIMYSKMLYSFKNKSDAQDGIGKITAEKMIVLYTKIGARMGMLKSFYSNFTVDPKDDNHEICRILRIKPYLKGPIALVGTARELAKNRYIPYITSERKSLWFTNLMLQNGKLLRVSGGKYAVREPEDLIAATDSDIRNTIIFSNLFGSVCNPTIETGVTFYEDDLVYISTCVLLRDIVASIAAEMEIFSNEFELRHLSGESLKEDRTLIQEFRANQFFESVNNASKKLRAFLTRKGQKLIASVKFSNDTEQGLWENYFSEELSNTLGDNNEPLLNILHIEEIWVYSMQILLNILYLIQINIYGNYYKKFWNNEKTQRSRQFIDDYMTHLSKTDYEDATELGLNLLVEKLTEQVNKRLPVIDSQGRLDDNDIVELLTILKEFEIKSLSIREDVCDSIGETGKIYDIIRYNQVIFINYMMVDESQLDLARELVQKALKKIEMELDVNNKAAISRGENPLVLPKIKRLPCNLHPSKSDATNQSGEWIIGCGKSVDDFITRLGLNVFLQFFNNHIITEVVFVNNLNYVNAIKESTSPNPEMRCNSFYGFIGTIENIIFPELIKASRIINIIEKPIQSKSFLKYYLNEKAKTYYRLCKEETYISPNTRKEYEKTSYECISERRPRMLYKDIGIITILDEETDAVVNTLGLKQEKFHMGGRLYYSGMIETQEQIKHNVVLTQAIDQGENSVISAYNDIYQKYKPSVIVLTGIAGGISESIDYCDVVIANQIIDYDTRKITEEGVEHRPKVYELSSVLKPLLQKVSLAVRSNPLDAAPESKNDSFNIFFEPIGSGNAVIAKKMNEVVEWLLKTNSKTVAVEMEAAGISSAFYEGQINQQGPQYGIIIVRGISDLANKEKTSTKNFRYPAALNAAKVVSTIIAQLPELPKK